MCEDTALCEWCHPCTGGSGLYKKVGGGSHGGQANKQRFSASASPWSLLQFLPWVPA